MLQSYFGCLWMYLTQYSGTILKSFRRQKMQRKIETSLAKDRAARGWVALFLFLLQGPLILEKSTQIHLAIEEGLGVGGYFR